MAWRGVTWRGGNDGKQTKRSVTYDMSGGACDVTRISICDNGGVSSRGGRVEGRRRDVAGIRPDPTYLPRPIPPRIMYNHVKNGTYVAFGGEKKKTGLPATRDGVN